MRDVIIIGAGPAGLAAAIACRKWNLDVLVIDEFPKPGGRLLGQLHQEPDGAWWNGIVETEKLLKEAFSLSTDIRNGVSCHNIEKSTENFIVYTNAGTFSSKKLLSAAGAAEVAAPVPGWTLPGVMSIGAAQVMTNVHRVRVGEKGVIVGANVLSAAIARELQLADINLLSMVLPVKNKANYNHSTPSKVMEGLVRIAHLAPSAFLRFGSKFAKADFVKKLAVKFYPKNGIKMWGMPIHLRKAVVSINGVDKVESVTLCKITPNGDIIKNSQKTVDVDFVCIAGGLYPLVESVSILGCPFIYLEELGGHVPVHNEQMETPVDGLYVAGNITGIESSKVAMSQGDVAGLSIVKSLLEDSFSIHVQLQKSVENVKKVRKNASIQFHPNITEGRDRISKTFNQIKE